MNAKKRQQQADRHRAQRQRRERSKERRDSMKQGARTLTIRKSTTTPHATVMVVDNPPWTPFVEATWVSHLAREGETVYINSRYQVSVFPAKDAYSEGFPRFIHLCFKHDANVAITDFRDMQRIKNELVHPEAFAFQIFPPESQLVDGANQYHLWVLIPDGFPEVVPDNPDDWPVLPYGFFDGRLVTDIAPTGGRQRTFESLPDDIVEGRVRGTTIVADHKARGEE